MIKDYAEIRIQYKKDKLHCKQLRDEPSSQNFESLFQLESDHSEPSKNDDDIEYNSFKEDGQKLLDFCS